MKLGGGTYCWMWAIGVPWQVLPPAPLNAFDLLDRCRQLSLRAVQFGPNLALDEERLDELAARAGEFGV